MAMLISSDTHVDMTEVMGAALRGFADALKALDSRVAMILGGRFEALAGACAAAVARIRIPSKHGVEATHGTLGDACRHAITKKSSIRSKASDEYRRRVIRLAGATGRV